MAARTTCILAVYFFASLSSTFMNPVTWHFISQSIQWPSNRVQRLHAHVRVTPHRTPLAWSLHGVVHLVVSHVLATPDGPAKLMQIINTTVTNYLCHMSLQLACLSTHDHTWASLIVETSTWLYKHPHQQQTRLETKSYNSLSLHVLQSRAIYCLGPICHSELDSYLSPFLLS